MKKTLTYKVRNDMKIKTLKENYFKKYWKRLLGKPLCKQI